MAASRRNELVTGAFVGGTALAVYLRTLAPGLVGIGDSPKLQYVGHVLGTAHPPGYPLYTLLTYIVTAIPIGTVAFRVNLFSALCAAGATALVYACCRMLESSRPAASAGSLGMAFGVVFWSQAVVAEVYTLAAALLAGAVLSLLLWQKTRRPAWYYAAVWLTALSLGHHLTIVTVIPALMIFALGVDRRFVLRGATLVRSAAIVLVGLSQYGYIVLRTLQNAPGRDSSASNLRELLRVVRAERFGSHLFSFSLGDVLTDRLALVGTILATELGVGLILVVLGIWQLARRRETRLTLSVLLCGSAGPVFFAINYDVGDLPVFLTLTFVLLAVVAGCSLPCRSRRSWPRMALCALVLLCPSFQLARNWATDDLHDRTTEARYLDALFRYLPRPASIVTEDYGAQHMLLYKMLVDGEHDVSILPPDQVHIGRARGQGPVFVLGPRTHRMWALPYPLQRISLPVMRIWDVLALRTGDLVIVTTTGSLSARAREQLGVLAQELGSDITGWHNDMILVGIAGDRRSGRVATGVLLSAPDDPLFREARGHPVRVVSSALRASISFDDRTVLGAESGVLLAFVRHGRVVRRYNVPSPGWLPYGDHLLPLSRLAPTRQASQGSSDRATQRSLN
jgi:hypothetical protein